jgi:hypothetical protein
VPRHDADVRDPKVLEQLAGLGEAHDRCTQSTRQLEQVRPEERHPLDQSVIRAPALAPGARQLDLRQVFGERADRRADRHLVVVDHDQHLTLALADVVERFERQPAHERRITDNDSDPLQPMAQVAGLREALGDRQPRARVTAIEHVVRRLRSTWEATDAVERAQRPEAIESTGQQLVRIRLVAGVPDDLVAR